MDEIKLKPCQMLREYVNTGLTPEQCENAKVIIESAFSDETSKAERIRELLKADRDGRLAAEKRKKKKEGECGQAKNDRAV